MYLIDSDILINYLKNRKEAVVILNKMGDEEVGTSVICIAEVLEGLSDRRRVEFMEFLKTIRIYDVDLRIVGLFAVIRKGLRQVGKLIDNMDIMIAATCMAYDLILVTGNKKHFERIKGLEILKI